MVEEEYSMLPSPTTTANQNQGGAGRRNQQRQNTGYEYITLKDLNHNKKLTKVIDVRQNESQAQNRFNDIILKVAFDGRTRLYGLKTSNPVFKTLFDAWGGNENDWVDHEFYLYTEQDDFTGREFARAEVANNEARTSKSGKR
jgi:hypothetical protein